MERLSAIEPARDRLLEGTRGSARAEKIKGARTVAPEKRASAQRYKKDGKVRCSCCNRCLYESSPCQASGPRRSRCALRPARLTLTLCSSSAVPHQSAFARGDYTLAVDYFSSAIELDPLDPDLLSCRASAYAALAAQSPELRAASAAARKDAAAAAALAARRAEGRGGELARLARSNLERRREAMETAYRDGENMLASTPGELDEMD